MAVGTWAVRASRAVGGGYVSNVPLEDGPEAGAVWGYCEAILEGNPGGTGTKTFEVKAAAPHNIVVGYAGIPGQRPLTSIFYATSRKWSGVQRR